MDRQTDRQTDTHDDYRNPLAHARRGLTTVTLAHARRGLTNTLCLTHIRELLLNTVFLNPRRACAARVTLCVCLSVCLSVTALAATAFVSACNQRHLRHYFRLFNSWIFEKAFRSKVMARKSQYANELELTASRFLAFSGPTKHSSYVKGNWWVECCFRD